MKTEVRLVRSLPLFALLSFALGAGACSDGGGGDGDSGGDGDGDEAPNYSYCSPADTCPPNLDGFDPNATVSFSADIYEGIFRQKCGGGSGCHGNASGSAANLYFGDTTDPPLDATQLTALIDQLKNAPSEIAPTERNVVAGSWETSWLMTKLDGCQKEAGISCDAESFHLMLSVCRDPCGDGMPATEGDTSNPDPYPLTPAERHLVRAWIAQGAEDN